jgi:alpha-tubulin suppressor-like RCC1 family protein
MSPVRSTMPTGCISLVAGAAHSFYIMENGEIYAVCVNKFVSLIFYSVAKMQKDS